MGAGASEAAATVVVLARAPRAGGCNEGLEPLLGPDRCAALQETLIRRAVAWARAAAGRGGDVVLAVDPPGERGGVAALVEGVEVWSASAAAAAVTAAYDRFGGPLLVATTDTPRLHPAHAAAALVDLREGADLAIGPAHDGGWYLLAMREPLAPVLGAATVAECLRAALDAHLEVGLLRMERDLATPHDAAALLADPLVPAEVRERLRT